tara:strand:- start:197 stop:823 length:627 start_codon:yes stop_codon:yes gene_type:complete
MYNMIRELMFSIPVFYHDLKNSNEINEKLKKLILDWRDEDKGVVKSNVLGWHSPVDMHTKHQFSFFIDEINNLQSEMHLTEGYANNTELRLDNMWANVSHKYSYNKFHTHPGSLWSGVYYVQSPPNCGKIIFRLLERGDHLRPMYDENNTKDEPHQWEFLTYEPIEGRAIFFPSWLGHEVEQNLTDVEGDDGCRISISFNTQQMKKET